MDEQNHTDRDLIEYILSILGPEQDMEEKRMPLPEKEKLYPLLEAVYLETANDVKSFMDKMPGGFFIYRANQEEDIIYANKALLWMFGCETMEEFSELTGNSFRGIVYFEDREEVEKSIWEQVTNSQNDLDYVEYRIVRKDGEIRWVEDYGHFVHSHAAGDIFYVFVIDSTEKRRQQKAERDAIIEEKLQREAYLKSQIDQYDKELKVIHKEHLRRLEVIEGLSANYESIFYADLDTDEILPYRLSSRVEEQFGGTLQVKGFTWFITDYVRTWVEPTEQESLMKTLEPECIRRRLSEKNTFYVNYRVRKDGETQYLQLRMADAGGQGTVSQIVMGCRRVDEEIRYEMEQKRILKEALEQARQANIVQTTFLSNMSHDIRTPLNAITGFTALAKNHIADSEKVEGYLGKIEMAGEQLIQLIGNILELSDMESGKNHKEETEFNLFDVMKDVRREMQPWAEAKGLIFSMELIGLKNSYVCGDREKLWRVLKHLVSNAVKYTEKGSILVSVSERRESSGEYMSYQFTVKDTGIGIRKADMARIFEPFERVENTTQSGVFGTGLGLTIAKRLVELMGGEIFVQSLYGEGSIFTVTLNLRLREQKAVSVEGTRNMVLEMLGGRRVLLVDDNEINLEIASELLQDMGILVDKAENGSVAIEKLISAGIEQYGLILMDIQMPVMNGYQAARAIREIGNPALAHIPIIALSANALEEDKRMAWESGMDAHMAKPFNLPELLELIVDIMAKKQIEI